MKFTPKVQINFLVRANVDQDGEGTEEDETYDYESEEPIWDKTPGEAPNAEPNQTSGQEPLVPQVSVSTSSPPLPSTPTSSGNK